MGLVGLEWVRMAAGVVSATAATAPRCEWSLIGLEEKEIKKESKEKKNKTKKNKQKKTRTSRRSSCGGDKTNVANGFFSFYFHAKWRGRSKKKTDNDLHHQRPKKKRKRKRRRRRRRRRRRSKKNDDRKKRENKKKNGSDRPTPMAIGVGRDGGWWWKMKQKLCDGTDLPSCFYRVFT